MQTIKPTDAGTCKHFCNIYYLDKNVKKLQKNGLKI